MDWQIGPVKPPSVDGLPPLGDRRVAVRSNGFTAVVQISKEEHALEDAGAEALRRVVRLVRATRAQAKATDPCDTPAEGLIEVSVKGEPPLYFTEETGVSGDRINTEYLLRYLWRHRKTQGHGLLNLARRIL
jgi:hypothetical protein